MSGILYVVATPIGHLQDITERARTILAQVDAIACEDTRHSRRLLDAYGIDKPLIPLHQHNEGGMSRALLARLQSGEAIALISDAGTPLISDPGQWLTRVSSEAGIRVVPLPGASSVMTALSAGGLPADQFVFAGFIPAKAAERTRFLATHTRSTMTTVFFETPHRIAATLAALAAQLDGRRELVIARELTKQFEQIVRLTVAEAETWLAADSHHARGEFVLLLAGAAEEQPDAGKWQAMARDLQQAGVSNKDCAALVAKYTGTKKKTVYQYVLEGCPPND